MPSVKKTQDRILIVDDDSSTRRMLCRFFEMRSRDAVSVSNAMDALRRIQEGDYSFAFVDCNLGSGPGDGIALAENLRAASAQLRIIVMSGDRNAKAAAKAVGFVHFLRKPFPLKKLEVLLDT